MESITWQLPISCDSFAALAVKTSQVMLRQSMTFCLGVCLVATWIHMCSAVACSGTVICADLATQYIDITQTCTTDPCANDDADRTRCCANRAVCDTDVGTCSDASFLDVLQKCAGSPCVVGDNTACCSDRADCDGTVTCPVPAIQYIDIAQTCTAAPCVDAAVFFCFFLFLRNTANTMLWYLRKKTAQRRLIK